MLHPRWTSALCIAAVGTLSACLWPHDSAASASLVAPRATASADMEALITEYSADERSVQRFEYIPFSEARLAHEDALAERWQSRLDAIDFNALDTAGRIDWTLLGGHIANERRQRDALRHRLTEETELLSFADVIITLEEARWRLDEVDPQAAALTLDALTEQIEAVHKRVKQGLKASKTKPDEDDPDEDSDDDDADDDDSDDDADDDDDAEDVEPIVAAPVTGRRAARHVGQLHSALRNWYRHYDEYLPSFSWWVAEPYKDVGKALNDYEELLQEKVAGLKGEDDDPLLGDPIGREALLGDIAGEMLAYDPEDLLAIGEREFAWCEARMREASEEMGFGDDWKAALEHVKKDFVPPGEQDLLVATQARDAIAFVTERDLVTVPDLAADLWRIQMISERGQRTLPFAAYSGQAIQVAYPTRGMDTDTKLMSMRGNNVHFTRIVTPHELIPGHHLQGFMAGRYNTHRRLFGTPFMTEGWALYWEMLLWDIDYARGPEDRVGMLFWRMHRAARIIVSLKFHLGEMSPDEMIDFLLERVGHERHGATSEVRRYIAGDYSPLYQCAYMIGGLQIRALYGDLVESGRMTDRQFHDTILKSGTMPIEMIRATLTETELTRDWTPTWRFAGEF
jgi:uncharacterized protein (DUF885 family)